MNVNNEFFVWLEHYEGMNKKQFLELPEEKRLELVSDFRNDQIMDCIEE